MILMLIKYQFLKKNHIAQRIHLNTLLDTIDDDVIRPLCLRLPQMTGYATKFNKRRQCLLELTNNF